MKIYKDRNCAYLLWLSIFILHNSIYAQHDPKQPFKGIQGKTLGDSKQWFPEKLKAPEGAPFGKDSNTPVDDANYKVPFAFTGALNKIIIESK